MGYWSYYFFLKMALYWGQFIDFHVWLNLAFAVFVALPLKRRALRIGRTVIAAPAAIALLYHDSWMPPLKRVMEQQDQLSQFSFIYLLELLGRFINLHLVLALLVMLLLYLMLERRLRMSSFAFLGLFIIALTPQVQALISRYAQHSTVAAAPASGGEPAEPAPSAMTDEQLKKRLENFHKYEATRRVSFVAPRAEDPPMDVIYLQVCSLAWDDMSYVDLTKHPLMQRFDVLFSKFNAAASYSGPAAIRLLRSACGQAPHEELYKPAPAECYLSEVLPRIGYEPQWAMNHQGLFGNMLDDISSRGNWPGRPMSLAGFKPAMKSFDGVENGYYDDYEILSSWWMKRIEMPAERVVLYYNTGSMHDGNRFIDGTRPNPHDSYQRRLNTLFAGIDRFIDLVEASGRRATIVLIPEHGAAARGDRMQIAGLREIPTPAITEIPVGVKIVNGKTPMAGAPMTVPTSTSFTALSTLLSRLIATDPYAPGISLAELVRDLPQTAAVSENQGTVIMKLGDTDMMRTPGGEWTPYRP